MKKIKQPLTACNAKKRMNIFNLDNYNRGIFYADNLILKFLSELNFDDFDKKQIVDLIVDGISNNKSSQQLASDFGHYTKNWNVDWHWISYHILGDYHNQRRANECQNLKTGREQLVYKECSKSNSEFNRLYLTDPNDRESQPKLFTLTELINNGTNIGLKKQDWKPTIGITDFGFYEYHPYDDSTNEKEVAHFYDDGMLILLPTGYEWNADKKEFELIEQPLTERRKKIRELIKIKITKT